MRSKARSRIRTRLIRVSKYSTWLCVVVLAALSWLPGDAVVRTGAPGQLEHFVAYTGTATIGAIGYGRRIGYIQVVLLFALYAGILEVGQIWVPGRHFGLIDYLASSSGAFVGTLAVY